MHAEVHFPNLEFNTKEIDFGCILNDTEVMQPGIMTNNSPLPVAYSWFFIKRPPVVRQEADLLDEGVDMESDYESDEVEAVGDDEGEEEGGEGGVAGGGRGSPEHHQPTGSPLSIDVVSSGEIPSAKKLSTSSRGQSPIGNNPKAVSPFIVIEDASRRVDSESQSIHVTIDSQPAVLGEEGAEEEGGVARPGSGDGDGGSDGANSVSSSGSLRDSSEMVLESGLPPTSPPLPAIVTTPPPQLQDENGGGRKKRKKKKPAWELAFDPFKPIPISQVHTYTCTCTCTVTWQIHVSF